MLRVEDCFINGRVDQMCRSLLSECLFYISVIVFGLVVMDF